MPWGIFSEEKIFSLQFDKLKILIIGTPMNFFNCWAICGNVQETNRTAETVPQFLTPIPTNSTNHKFVPLLPRLQQAVNLTVAKDFLAQAGVFIFICGSYSSVELLRMSHFIGVYPSGNHPIPFIQ